MEVQILMIMTNRGLHVPTQRVIKTNAKLIMSLGIISLALANCAKQPPRVASVPAPTPVGHVYAVAVDVPPPVSLSIKFSSDQKLHVQQAFNVIGLKSALMVAALSCGQQDKYDAFMLSFKSHILDEQHVMDAYFHKASGRYSGQKMEDTFVTLLANNQSDAGIAQGSVFCLNNSAEFNAVLALKSPQDLDAFVTSQPPLSATTVASVAQPTP